MSIISVESEQQERNPKRNRIMLHDFEEINAILSAMHDEGMVEPIDENDCHPLDWAEVVGIVDEVFDDVYPEAEMI
jgi:hypothetical protein